MFRLSARSPSTGLGILAALVVVAIGAGVVAALESIAEPASLGIVFIPGVLLIATVWGLRLRLGTAVLSALVFNFFYLPPLRDFSIDAQHDIVALVVFVIVAIASGTLAELARARASSARVPEAIATITKTTRATMSCWALTWKSRSGGR